MSRDFTHVAYQAIHQLDIIHFQREEADRNMIIDSHILGNTQGKRGLTHRRTSGNDNKVGRLPATGHIVETCITCRNTGESTRVLGGTLQNIDSVLDDRVNLGIVLLHVVLRQREEFSLSMLHQLVYIDTLVEGLCLNIRGIMDKLALKSFLSQDAGMILDMGCRCHLRGDIHEIGGSTHTVNLTHLGKFVDERHDIHRTLLHIHLLYGLIDFLMTRLIEGGWLQHL